MSTPDQSPFLAIESLLATITSRLEHLERRINDRDQVLFDLNTAIKDCSRGLEIAKTRIATKDRTIDKLKETVRRHDKLLKEMRKDLGVDPGERIEAMEEKLQRNEELLKAMREDLGMDASESSEKGEEDGGQEEGEVGERMGGEREEERGMKAEYLAERVAPEPVSPAEEPVDESVVLTMEQMLSQDILQWYCPSCTTLQDDGGVACFQKGHFVWCSTHQCCWNSLLGCDREECKKAFAGRMMAVDVDSEEDEDVESGGVML